MRGWLQLHSRSLLFLLFVFALGGIFAAWKLPVGLFKQRALIREFGRLCVDGALLFLELV